MREDYFIFGGSSFVFGGFAFGLSFEFPLQFSYILGKDTVFYFRYGGLFLLLIGIVILLAGIGTREAGSLDDPVDEELGVIRNPPKN